MNLLGSWVYSFDARSYSFFVGDGKGLGVSNNSSKVLLKGMRYCELEVCLSLFFIWVFWFLFLCVSLKLTSCSISTVQWTLYSLLLFIDGKTCQLNHGLVYVLVLLFMLLVSYLLKDRKLFQCSKFTITTLYRAFGFIIFDAQLVRSCDQIYLIWVVFQTRTWTAA